MASSFVHLHNHTDFSLLKGASSIPGLVGRIQELEMDAVAITDDGNLFGALTFYKQCRVAGIKPIIGCDFYVAEESRHRKSGLDSGMRANRVVLLASNEAGYRNLIRLTSYAYTEGFYYRPRIDHELMETYREGLILLSGSLSGELPRLLLANRRDEALSLARWYREVYGEGNAYIELTDHGIPEQRVLLDMLSDIAETAGLPLVAANDTHYLRREDANAQDVLLCIGAAKKKSDTNRFRFSTDEFYVKSAAEMEERFSAYPEAIANSRAIADAVDITVDLPGPRFPVYEIPADHENRDEYLRYLTREGLVERYAKVTPALEERAERELDVIISMGFTGYFLIVWDFIKFARDNGIPVGPGRGSGAGSIVAYALKITDIDPLRYGLLFERFLNPERISMPDFDIDFCFERRGEVIDYVTGKYGDSKVGQIITFGTLKAKLVIRDVARVLGLAFEEADAIAKLVPRDLKMTLEKALKVEPRLSELGERGDVYEELIDVSRRLEGLHRHASTHAAGVVIGEKDLIEYVPLYRDSKTGSISTQYSMELLEDCGLVKMDFLGLKTLTLLKNTEALIRQRDAAFSIDAIREDDPATFEMLGKGLSRAIFQFESSGMQDVLRRARPDKIEDLIALNALYRPGPMQFIDKFVDSKNGRTAITYPLPALESILKETYGVIVYQEQVMEIVQTVGGFSLGQADILRRAMGKKKEDEMARMQVDFVRGAGERGYSEAQANEIFELLQPFAGYGFNKSHAAAYSVLAYQTAYLKANHPVEFIAANLTNEVGNPDKFAEYLEEAQVLEIGVIPPDVNRSRKYFAVDGNDVVFGLVGIKNIGGGAVDAIVEERDQNGPYRSFSDFLERHDMRVVNKKVVETAIQVGLFDSLGTNRATLAANLDRLVDAASYQREGRASGQSSLFGDDETVQNVPIEPRPEWDATERLAYERDLLGFYFSGHPLDDYREYIRAAATINLARPESAIAGQRYTVVGLVKAIRTVITKRGDRMAFATLEDLSGEIDVVLFPEPFAAYEESLIPNTVVGCIGTIEQRNGEYQFVLAEVRPLDELDERDDGAVHVRIAGDSVNEETLYLLRGDLGGYAGGADLFLHIPSGDGETVIKASAQLRVSSKRETLARLRDHPLVKETWKE